MNYVFAYTIQENNTTIGFMLIAADTMIASLIMAKEISDDFVRNQPLRQVDTHSCGKVEGMIYQGPPGVINIDW